MMIKYIDKCIDGSRQSKLGLYDGLHWWWWRFHDLDIFASSSYGIAIEHNMLNLATSKKNTAWKKQTHVFVGDDAFAIRTYISQGVWSWRIARYQSSSAIRIVENAFGIATKVYIE